MRSSKIELTGAGPKIAGLAATLGLLFVAAPASALPGMYRDLFTSCASQINSMPIDARMPPNRSSAVVHPRSPNQIGQAACQDFNWVKLKGNIGWARISWRGRTTTSAWDCSHSTMAWAMYRKQANGTWSMVGGGGSYGNMPGGDGGQCLYDGTGFPQTENWGLFIADTGGAATAEYRIAFHTWSHDSQNLGHGDYCADPLNCSWPIGIELGASNLVPPKQDWAIWRPSTNTWWYSDTSSSTSYTVPWNDRFGAATGRSIANGDFDGDGQSDFAVTRIVGDGKSWEWIESSTNVGQTMWWGRSNDTVLRNADYDGDGRSDVAVWQNSDGLFNIKLSNTWATWTPRWGQWLDRVVIGNYDDDLRTDLAIWRPDEGNWYIIKSLSWTVMPVLQWGMYGDMPIGADFDGDNRTDRTVWRPSNGTFYWVDSGDGQMLSRQWGMNGDVPMATYLDSDNVTDATVFRPSEGRWYYLLSTTGSGFWTAWGQSGDQPAAPFSRGG